MTDETTTLFENETVKWSKWFTPQNKNYRALENKKYIFCGWNYFSVFTEKLKKSLRCKVIFKGNLNNNKKYNKTF